MTVPNVRINEIDGALGIVPANLVTLHAFMGGALGGPLNMPATFARVSDLVATFVGGPLVEAVALYIVQTGNPAMVVRVPTTTTPVLGTVTHTGTGTAVVTVDAASVPQDDYEIVLKIVAGGTVGTAGVTYQTSLDGGQSFSATTPLGTATSINVGGVTLTLVAAETLVAGDTYSVRVSAATWQGTDLTAGLESLRTTSLSWEQLIMVGPMVPAAAAVVDSAIAGFSNAPGKDCSWIGHVRLPNEGESDATYQTAVSTAWQGTATTYGTLCAAACRVPSGVSGRNYRRSPLFPVAVAQSCTEEVNIADPNLGALRGVSIRDANGNLVEHDEAATPGLDDARFLALRTIDGYQGVYVNRPLILSATGSDFSLIPHRRVMNLAKRTLRAYFVRRLNRPVRIAPSGFILEADALEIEGGALALLRSALLSKPKASDAQFTLSRTDNLLSTKTLTATCRIIPLAYPEFIEIEIGFYNPALSTLAA